MLDTPVHVAPWRWAVISILLLAAVAAGFAGGKKAQDEAEKERYGYPVPPPAVRVDG